MDIGLIGNVHLLDFLWRKQFAASVSALTILTKEEFVPWSEENIRFILRVIWHGEKPFMQHCTSTVKCYSSSAGNKKASGYIVQTRSFRWCVLILWTRPCTKLSSLEKCFRSDAKQNASFMLWKDAYEKGWSTSPLRTNFWTKILNKT